VQNVKLFLHEPQASEGKPGVMSADDPVSRLLEALSEAKTWPERFQVRLEAGADIRHEISESDKRIEALEKQAKDAMKRLGCVSPQTRKVYHGMADMLINWQTFKDGLK
jgi:hypothetical protein